MRELKGYVMKNPSGEWRVEVLTPLGELVSEIVTTDKPHIYTDADKICVASARDGLGVVVRIDDLVLTPEAEQMLRVSSWVWFREKVRR